MPQDAMSPSARMKSAIERDIKAVKMRPSVARGRERITVTAGSDAICTVTDGDQSLKVDLGKGHGGEGTTPGPGFLVGAALGSCVAQAYLSWAAYLDVPINRVKVEILADYDATATLGLESDASCGYTSVRLVVEVDSPAPHAEIERVVETADRRDFMLAVFAEAQPVKRELRVTDSAPNAGNGPND